VVGTARRLDAEWAVMVAMSWMLPAAIAVIGYHNEWHPVLAVGGIVMSSIIPGSVSWGVLKPLLTGRGRSAAEPGSSGWVC